jgi:hypothetical protein
MAGFRFGAHCGLSSDIARGLRKVPLATNAPQQTASLFNHVVSKGEQRRRHSEAERLGGLQVDE